MPHSGPRSTSPAQPSMRGRLTQRSVSLPSLSSLFACSIPACAALTASLGFILSASVAAVSAIVNAGTSKKTRARGVNYPTRQVLNRAPTMHPLPPTPPHAQYSMTRSLDIPRWRSRPRVFVGTDRFGGIDHEGRGFIMCRCQQQLGQQQYAPCAPPAATVEKSRGRMVVTTYFLDGGVGEGGRRSDRGCRQPAFPSSASSRARSISMRTRRPPDPYSGDPEQSTGSVTIT